MRIILLGTGTPIIDVERMGPSTLIDLSNEYFLFDAGRGVVLQLSKANIDYDKIGVIFITHHHVDHISDLGDLLLTIWKSGRTNKIQIIGPPGTSEIVLTLLNRIFIRDIEYTLALQNHLNSPMIDIRNIIDVRDVTTGIVFQNEKVCIKAEYVEHGQEFLKFLQDDWPSLGYRIETSQKVIAISGDCIDCIGLMKIAQNADILIQCCYLAEIEFKSQEFRLIANYILSSSDTIGKFATKYKIRMLVLTHFRKKSVNMMESIKSDIKKNFRGQLFLGYDLESIDIT